MVSDSTPLGIDDPAGPIKNLRPAIDAVLELQSANREFSWSKNETNLSWSNGSFEKGGKTTTSFQSSIAALPTIDRSRNSFQRN